MWDGTVTKLGGKIFRYLEEKNKIIKAARSNSLYKSGKK